MGKILSKLIIVLLTILFTLTSCDTSSNSPSVHEHTFASFRVTNEEYHWHPSTCGHDVQGEKGRHEFVSETSENGNTVYTCSICHYSYLDGDIDADDTFTVTRENYDGTVLEIDENVSYGTAPTYDGDTPIKESDDRYNYEFNGWTPELKPVTKDITYTAVFSSEEVTYTVTWENYDGTVLEIDENVPYGTAPTYDGDTPIKESDDRYNYEFNGWTPELKPVTKDITYTAVFSSEEVTYTVTWENYDGTVLEIDENVPYGTAPTYDGDTPIKESDDRYNYEFNGWIPELKPVTKDITYTAVFSSEEISYTIDFDLNGGTSSSYKGPIKVLAFSKDIFFFDCVKEGWHFRGREYNGEKIFDENGKQLKDVTLVDHMVFEAIYSQTVKLTIVTNMPEAGTITGEGEYPFNTYVDVSVKTNQGYSFVGWYCQDALLSNEEAYKYMVGNTDIVLEAKFEKDDFNFRIYSNNEECGLVLLKGENNSDYLPEYKDIIEHTSEVTVSASSKTNVRFLGWYDEDNNLVSSNAVYTFDMPNYDYTLEAKWNYFTINYNLNGGTNNKNNTDHFDLEDNTIYLFAPTKEGYTFEGRKYNGEFVDKIDTSIANNITLEAVWRSLFEYEIKEDDNGKYATITGFDGNSVTDIVIPETVLSTNDEIIVKVIGNEVFEYNDNIVSVTIPDSVTTIGDSAFSGCSNLTTVTIGENSQLKEIGNNAFQGCSSLTSIYIPNSVTTIGDYAFSNCSNLTTVTIGENSQLIEIGNNAFQSCSSLTSIYIPNSVTTIGDSAFSDCFNLTTVTIGENSQITTIGSSAFSNCSSLTSIFIPSSVTTIREDTFYNCSSLTIYCETSSKPNGWAYYWNSSERPVVWSSYKGIHCIFNGLEYIVCIDEDGNKFISIAGYSGSSTDIVIPEYINVNGEDIIVREINDRAFYDNDIIKSVSIPNCVTTIGSSAFSNCSSLTSIFIPDSVTTIGSSAFSNCSNLTTATISENSNLTTIEISAFSNCSSLTSIFIPSSVTTIGEDTFYNCSSLTIYCETSSKPSGWNSYWNSSDRPVVWSSYKGINGNSNGLEYIACYDIEGNHYIVITGYSGSNTDVVIPEYINVNGEDIIVREINNNAFYNNNVITSVTIPNSVTTIESYAFSNCSSLASIFIPDSVTSIGEDAFFYCSNLTIYCETSSKPNGWAYYWNSSYRPVVWSSYKGINGNSNGLEYIAYHDIEGNPYIVITGYNGSKTDVVIPKYINVNGEDIIVREINDNAFYNNNTITSVTIPNSVTSIGNYVFFNCSSLVSIFIPDSVTTIGTEAFYNCSNLTIFCETPSKPNGWDSSWNPYNRNVVRNCIDGGITAEGIHYGVLVDDDGNKYITIAGYSGSNTEVVIPEYINVNGEDIIVREINNNAFYNNNTITSVTIPNSVTSIGYYAFSNCSSLASIFIPDSVTTIGTEAFYNCSILTIFCETSSKPNGWDPLWNCYNRPVIWSSYNGIYGNFNGFKYGVCIDEDGNKYISIAGYSGSNTDLVIPEHINVNGEDIIVKEINNNAFYNNNTITSVTIPNSVTSIGNYAFSNCSSLTSIFIPDSVTTIGYDTFSNCSNLTIYCETSSKPNGWDSSWNSYNHNVVRNCIDGGITAEGIHFGVLIDDDGNKYITIAGYSGSSTDVVIPEYINVNGEDIIVKEINNNAFYNNNTITSVTIPNSVTSIGYYAFYNCPSLTSIFIPDSVTTIGTVAFYNCSNLTIYCETSSKPDGRDPQWNLYYRPVVWSSYKGIYGNFNGFKYGVCIDEDGNKYISIAGNSGSNTDVVIPEYINVNGEDIIVKSIADNAFYENDTITSVTISKNVTSIGNYTFSNCSSLTSIFIPSSVTTIESGAFSNCSNLTIYCETSSKPSGWNFYWNSSYRPVVRSSYKGINGNSNGLEYIACHDIEGNPYIVITGYSGSNTDVVIPEYINVNGEDFIVKAINDNVFYNNNTITSVTIPDSVAMMGEEVFYNCSNLTIYCEASSESSGWASSWNASNRPVVWSYYKGIYGNFNGFKYVICIDGDGNKYITIVGYSGSNTDVVIPEYINVNGEEIIVRIITDNAFYKNDTITSVTIPDSVTSIGDYAFSHCSNLTIITIGENSQLTTIGLKAFRYCSSLTLIYIPDSVTTIEFGAFSYCSKLTTVTIGENSQLTIIGNHAFAWCSSLTSIYIPNSVTSIGYYAFYDCSKLTTVTIGENSQLTTIGSRAFQYCSSLTSIYIPSSVTSIDYYAFENCPNLTIYCEASSKPSGWSSNWNYSSRPVVWSSYKGIHGFLNGFEYGVCIDEDGNKYISIAGYSGSNTDVVIPEYINVNGEDIIVRIITNNAFYKNDTITSVTIPNSVTTIGAAVFYDCSNLAAVTIGENSQLTTMGNSAFFGCSSLTSIFIPDSVITIGSSAFYNCSNLTAVTIGENSQLTTMGNSVFSGCSSLASVYIPNSVTTIGYRAFDDCSSLTSIYIPGSVTFIDGCAFSGCSNLIVYCEAPSQHSNWDSDWNYSNRPVVWNTTYEEYLAAIG